MTAGSLFIACALLKGYCKHMHDAQTWSYKNIPQLYLNKLNFFFLYFIFEKYTCQM